MDVKFSCSFVLSDQPIGALGGHAHAAVCLQLQRDHASTQNV